MKFECPKCKKCGTIDDSNVPESGIYATCPDCKERFLIKKSVEFIFETIKPIPKQVDIKSSYASKPLLPPNKSANDTKIIIVSVICLLVVLSLGVGYYFYHSKNVAAVPSANMPAVNPPTINVNAGQEQNTTTQELAKQSEIQRQQMEQAQQAQVQRQLIEQAQQSELQRQQYEQQVKQAELQRQNAENAQRMQQYERQQQIEREREARERQKRESYERCKRERCVDISGKSAAFIGMRMIEMCAECEKILSQ